MNKKDLKELLTPLIKEVLKEEIKKINLSEIVIKSGVIQEVVSQCVQGISPTTITESPQPKNKYVHDVHNPHSQLNENKRAKTQAKVKNKIKSLAEATGLGAKVFQSTVSSIENSPTPNNTLAENLKSGGNEAVIASSSPLSRNGIDASDPGVDINGIVNVAGGLGRWNRTAFGKKRK